MSDQSRRSPIVILVVALAWLVAVAAGVIAAGFDASGLDAAALARYVAALVVRLAPPLGLLLVAVELLRRSARGDDEAMAELEARTAAAAAAGQAVRDGLLDLDATLTAIGGRLDDLRAATATEAPRLVDAAHAIETMTGRLATAGDTTAATARDLAGVIPAAQRHADALTATLAATGDGAVRQLGEVETMLAGVLTRQHEIAGQVAAIAASAEAAATAIDDRTGTLAATVDAALTRTAAALDAVRGNVATQAAAMQASVDAQAATMLASIDAAKTGLDAIGGPVAATVKARVDHIVAASATLGDSLADHDARTAAMIATIERSFTVLDKRLGHATAMGTATLDAFHGRMTAVRDLADAVPPRLDAVVARLDGIDAATTRLGPAAATAEALGRQLTALAAPAADLAADLSGARAELARIEQAAHGSALSAARQLIEVLGRVREVAGTAAGTLRDTLADVVAEAETALAEAGARTAATAFADPIRHEIAGLEGAAALAGEAAQATADRIAARLLGLTQVVATVEKRLAEVAP